MLSGMFIIVGVIISTAGSFLTLWTIIRDGKKKDDYPHGTYGWLESLHDSFPKEQKKAKIGCVMIIVGGILQVAGTIVSMM